MMPGTKRKRPSAPQPKTGGQVHGNKGPFSPAPVRYDVGGPHTRTQGLEHFSKDEKGTGKKLS